MKKISIALVDDHVLFRKGLAAILKTFESIEIVHQASNGVELLEMLKNVEVDVVLLDLEMQGMDGMQTTKKLNEAFPEVKIIILSMYDDDHFIQHLMELGANGYLLKDTEPEEVILAVQSAYENGFYFNERVSKVVINGLIKKNKVKPVFRGNVKLSPRELEVLALICQEQTNVEIGEQLFLSSRTIEGYRNRLLEKTNTRNTAGLVVFALKNNLVEL
ncbi:response regulator [Lewinella sp. LCG006]|uniref:response regulator n=1 Tax=Lewinella sp. LCG006 TaxID=3231911 RepID=UPI00345FF9F9